METDTSNTSNTEALERFTPTTRAARHEALRIAMRESLRAAKNGGTLEDMTRALRAACALQRDTVDDKGERMTAWNGRRALEAIKGICRIGDWKKGKVRYLGGPYGASHGSRKSAGEDPQALAAALNYHRGGGSLWSRHPWEASRAGTRAAGADTLAHVWLALMGSQSSACAAWRRALGVDNPTRAMVP